MLKKSACLSSNIFSKEVEEVPTRDGYGLGLVEAGRKDDRIVALSADVSGSTRTEYFNKEFPNRFIQVGVAEQSMATVASGMANYGKIPFIASYAAFSPGRNWEQIRTTIALNDVPVKIAGHYTGVTVGPDGATHQALEDIALMRVMPNMIVVVPCDAIEARKATFAAAGNGKPTYLRFTREKTPVITTEDTPFEIGKAEIFWETEDQNKGQTTKDKVVIIACGPLVYEALLAAKELEAEKFAVTVVNCHTIKPIDEELIVSVAKEYKAVVTVEEHQVTGGLGGAVAEVLARNYPVPMEFVGVQDSFGESGEPDELLEKYKMKKNDIIQAVKKVVSRKKK